jgi:hypothetical protein
MEYDLLLAQVAAIAKDSGWDDEETIRSIVAVIHTAAEEKPSAIDLIYFLEALAGMKDAEHPPTSH